MGKDVDVDMNMDMDMDIDTVYSGYKASLFLAFPTYPSK
jgi:hypothetical protein